MKKLLFLASLALATSPLHSYNKQDLEKAQKVCALGTLLIPATLLADRCLPDFKYKKTTERNTLAFGGASIIGYDILSAALENDTELIGKIYGIVLCILEEKKPYSSWTENDKKFIGLNIAQQIAQIVGTYTANQILKKFLGQNQYRLARRALRATSTALIAGATLYAKAAIVEKYTLPLDKKDMFWERFIQELIVQTLVEVCGELVLSHMDNQPN